MDISLGSIHAGAGRARQSESGVNALANNDKLFAQKREMKLRQAEEERLEALRARIMEIEAKDFSDDPALDAQIKEAKIATILEQIKQIEEARAQREQEQIKREIEKREKEAEKQRIAAEKKQQEAEAIRSEEEGRTDAALSSDISGMVKLSLSNEAIQTFQQVKAGMSAEATRLKLDIDNSFGVSKYGRVPDGYATPDDFRNTQLKKLNKGIAGLETAIAFEVRKMNAITNPPDEDVSENTTAVAPPEEDANEQEKDAAAAKAQQPDDTLAD